MAQSKPAKRAAAKPQKPAAKGKAAPAPKAVNHKARKPTKSAPQATKKAAPPALNKAPVKANDKKLTPFLRQQKDRLLALRDHMLDTMNGVAQDTLRSRAEGSEASAFGMHQADAGSDAYDRDFALSLLSQEQDALYEIEQGLKRIEQGTYGVCEMSGKSIPRARLEAIPFARFTVECQSQLEKQNKMSRTRQSVTSLFGLTDDEEKEGEAEESETTPAPESKE